MAASRMVAFVILASLSSGSVSLFTVPSASAQEIAYRGFGEARFIGYPQTTGRDDDHLAVEGRVRIEPVAKPASWLILSGSAEGRADNLQQVERDWRVRWSDRGTRRPAFAIRQASARLTRGHVVAEIGKQFVRWGKTDILVPTDRFAPKDFLEVTADEFLAVTAARVQYQAGAHSLDVVWVPTFTPSRTPLLERRWAAVPDDAATVTLVDAGAVFPRRSQAGVRWNFVGSGYEASISYFDGFNHLPEFRYAVLDAGRTLHVSRSYAPLKMAGVDGALPLRWFTIKAEVAVLDTTSATADDVVMYVVQLERLAGELSIVAGYAGEAVTDRRSNIDFAPDRGLARAVLARVGYTVDANRSVAVEAAVRENLDAALVKAEYSQARGAHWRIIVAATAIGGKPNDFLGQYRRNSHVLLSARYSF